MPTETSSNGSAPTLERRGAVFVLDLGSGDNRIGGNWVEAVGAVLDEVESAPLPRALVTTATRKNWSLGFDLDWFAANAELVPRFVAAYHELLARLLTLGAPTVAAVQGHTFAGGALLAIAHDQRVMRADRGYFCLPEVDLGLAFTPGMSALIAARLPANVAHEAMTTGRRYGGSEAQEVGIVNDAVGADQVLPRALELAGALADKQAATLATIKERLYGAATQALRDARLNGAAIGAERLPASGQGADGDAS